MTDDKLIRLENQKSELMNTKNKGKMIPYLNILNGAFLAVGIVIYHSPWFRIWLAFAVFGYIVSNAFFLWESHQMLEDSLESQVDFMIKIEKINTGRRV